MNLMTLRTLALAGCVLAVFLAGAWINGLRWEARYSAAQAAHQSTLTEIANAAAAQLRTQQAQRQALETRLSQLDAQRYQELTHAQQATDRLAADLAAARQRLLVKIRPAGSGGVPAAAGAAGLDDGADTAELHPEIAAELARLAGDADRCAVKLSALQGWVKEVTKGGG